MKKIMALISFFLLLQTPVFADAYIKSRMLGGMGETEVWTNGKKQRTVTQAPMVGEMISIIRADKGVEWDIRPSLKAYSERSIAAEYGPGDAANAEDKEAEKEFDAMLKQGDQSSGQGDCKSTRVPGERIFAGMKAEGYQGSCTSKDGQQTPSTTFWIAAANESKAAKIQKEIEIFEKAHFESIYSKYPAKDRERSIKFMTMIGTAMGQGLMGIPDAKNMPQRLPLAMETEGQGNTGLVKNVMMEVLEAELVSGDESRYEVPQGFTKVENLDELQSQQMMNEASNGNMNMENLAGGLQQVAQNMGIQPDALEDDQNQGFSQQGISAGPASNQGQAYEPPLNPNGYPQQAGFASQQGNQKRTAQQRPPANNNNLQGTLHEVNQLLQNVQGITSQLGGGLNALPSYEQIGNTDSPSEYSDSTESDQAGIESEPTDDYQENSNL